MRSGIVTTEIVSAHDCEDLSPSRCQRINRLANDFLAGQPLYIASAQATGSDLRESLRTILKERRVPESSLDYDHDDAVWADEPEPWTSSPQRRHKRARMAKAASSVNTATAFPTTTRPQLSTRPSEEALLKAAELRARRVHEHPMRVQPITAPVVHSAPPTARKTTSFDQREESRRIYPRTPADDTLADELRLSRTESPSRRPRATGLPLLDHGWASTDETITNTPAGERGGDQTQHSANEHESSALHEDGEPAPSDPACLITNNGTDGSACSLSLAGPSTAELGSTAMDLCTAEQNKANRPLHTTTWTAINAQAPDTTVGVMQARTSTKSATNRLSVTERSGSSPVQESARSETPRATSRKARASKTVKSDRRSTVSHRSSQTSAGQPSLKKALRIQKTAFVSAPASQSGSTPFVYRKRAKYTDDADTDISEGRGRTHRSTDHEGEATSREKSSRPTPDSHTIGCQDDAMAAASVIDISLKQDSDFARTINLALMEQHTNKRLPTESDSARRTSSVRRALRREMRMSGAQISAVPGEPLSSQPQPSADDSTFHADTIVESSDQASGKRRRTTMQWPGTQMLLNQAQNDLFTSPEKNTLSSHLTNDGQAELEQTDDSAETVRLPLRQLSQECLPGTQALVEGWSPWSTVKKAKTTKRASFAPSPLDECNKTTTPSERTVRTRRSSTTYRDDQPKTSNRRSSLRFSMSTAETPVPLHRKSSALRPSMTDSQLLADTTIRPVSSAPAAGQTTLSAVDNVDTTMLSFAATNAAFAEAEGGSTTDISSGNQYSSFQAAQVVREDSNPERTLAELATEFLSTADMDTVLG